MTKINSASTRENLSLGHIVCAPGCKAFPPGGGLSPSMFIAVEKPAPARMLQGGCHISSAAPSGTFPGAGTAVLLSLWVEGGEALDQNT